MNKKSMKRYIKLLEQSVEYLVAKHSPAAVTPGNPSGPHLYYIEGPPGPPGPAGPMGPMGPQGASAYCDCE